MRLRTSRTVLSLLAVVAVSSVFADLSGCSSSSQGVAPSDASSDVVSGDSAGSECAGDPPVMQWTDSMGALHDPDWSCYEADAAYAAPPPRAPFAEAGDDGSSDATAPDGDDGGSSDATGAPETGPPADAGLPEAGPVQDIFQLGDFITHQPVPGATIDVFFGNTLANNASPEATGVTSTSDAGPAGYAGFFMPPPPGAVFAYRVRARTADPALDEVIQFDNLTPVPGTAFSGYSITAGTFQTLLAGVTGTTQTAPNTAVLVAGVRDCASHELLGGMLKLLDDDTSQPVPTGTGPTDTHTEYFAADNLPHAECTHTIPSPYALWAAVNVPVSRPLRIEVWGRMHASDTEPVLLGSRKLELYPSTIVIARAYRLTPLH